MTQSAPTLAALMDMLAPFDHRRALRMLSHASRMRSRRQETPATLTFVVHLDA